ncbi:hypothetical protein [Anaerospora sp.]|uniref:hypothetical protein n=1 Tax=Anaerospora sp. TaxID=1960278 RepID=UPI00289E3162|nr:hypothetical protein [Anaerospora sp.]
MIWLVGLFVSGMMVLAGVSVIIDPNEVSSIAVNGSVTLACAVLTWWFYKKYKIAKALKSQDIDLKNKK